MLHVHHSNRLERLVDVLVSVTASGLSDPFSPEIVVVQNQGTALWVAQQVAERTGISANLDFPLPAAFVWKIFRSWFPETPEQSLFDKDDLLWRAMADLPGHLDQSAFAELGRYLDDEESDLKRYQLCRRIADLFDQYLVFRPDGVLGWEQGEETHWQAVLWRSLAERTRGIHRAHLLQRFRAAVAASSPVPADLPERVCLFGLTALAPAYLEVMFGLARYRDIHIFLHNPCREYWADIVDDKGQARRRARSRQSGGPDPTGLLDVGNPLLASMGHAGQVFLDQLLDLGCLDHDNFEVPDGGALLQHLQRDILYLIDRRRPDSDQRQVLSERDHSLQVHVCHSPLREIQVLHDRLLRLFEVLEGLEPRDVVVMAPDIDPYAPYVDAVFSAVAENHRIPWVIADRRVRAEQPLLDAVFALLDLPASRMAASEVLSLLEVPAVQRRFGLDRAGVARIHLWVRESGIRWGKDAVMREDLDLPAEPANTWDFGLGRLFLGYAMPAAGSDTPIDCVLPYPDVEGGEAEYLGMLQTLIIRLADWGGRLRHRYEPSEWQRVLNRLLEEFFAPDEREEELLQTVRDAVDGLREKSGTGGFIEPLTLETVRAYLEAVLGEPPGGAQRFLTGRVTFCNMVPMRSIPFRVVCLIGMNGSDFPRIQRPLTFDLIAQDPQRGDRSRRQDDRYLFLEALLSAREVFYLSYVGSDVRDNSIKVPSVVLSELIDYAGRAYRPDSGGDLRQQLMLHHPLQPFSRHYFDGGDPRLFSYANEWLQAARVANGQGVAPFADSPLHDPDERLRTVDVDDLTRFLVNPAAYFLRQRLGVRLPEEAEVPEDVEPFDLAGLEKYQLKQALLQRLLERRDLSEAIRWLRAAGSLPHGAPGDLIVREEATGAEDFITRLAGCAAQPLEPIEVDLPLGNFLLQGQLHDLTVDGVLAWRFGKLRAKDRLRLWVRHLVLNVLDPGGAALESVHLAEDIQITLAPVQDAVALLTELLAIRWRGLREPVPFFPESSLSWVETGGYGRAFYQAWSSEHNPQADANDAAISVAFRGRAPLGEAFEDYAQRILGPMVNASTLNPVRGSKR